MELSDSGIENRGLPEMILWQNKICLRDYESFHFEFLTKPVKYKVCVKSLSGLKRAGKEDTYQYD